MKNYITELSNIELIRFAQKLIKLNYIDSQEYQITTFERDRKTCTFYFNSNEDLRLELFNNKAVCTFGESKDKEDIDKMWKLELYKYFGQEFLQDFHDSGLTYLTSEANTKQSNIDKFNQEYQSLTEFIKDRKLSEMCK